MNDEQATISDLKDLVARFIEERDWQKYHRPKDLAMSIAIEAGELMEHFQWLEHEECDARLADPALREKMADEMADVLAFLLSLSHATHIDLAASFAAKMQKNAEKYPADEVKGHYERPDRGAPKGGRQEAQVGQRYGDTTGGGVTRGTEEVAVRSEAGRSESTISAQPEHNMSRTGGELPADLAALVDAWPRLPEPIKAGVLAMVRAATDSAPECS